VILEVVKIQRFFIFWCLMFFPLLLFGLHSPSPLGHSSTKLHLPKSFPCRGGQFRKSIVSIPLFSLPIFRSGQRAQKTGIKLGWTKAREKKQRNTGFMKRVCLEFANLLPHLPTHTTQHSPSPTSPRLGRTQRRRCEMVVPTHVSGRPPAHVPEAGVDFVDTRSLR
jgi:hypothetical protein